MEADRFHTMFLAMADARTMLIKPADRLQNALPLRKDNKRSLAKTVPRWRSLLLDKLTILAQTVSKWRETYQFQLKVQIRRAKIDAYDKLRFGFCWLIGNNKKSALANTLHFEMLQSG
ncbi:hypothetical protein Tco_1430225 [Tanacetum coccineum]